MNAPQGFIGQSIERREDARFLTGRGTYTDDIVLPRQTYGVFVRSPYAHARIRKLDTSAAAHASGVVGILTGDDFKAVGGLPCGWLINSIDGTAMKEPRHPVLADGKVRYVGDRVALVVAETAQQARDAAALVDVDYEELPAVVDLAGTDGAGAPVHDEAPDNQCYLWSIGDRDGTDAAIKSAPHVSRLTFRNNRLIPNAIEPRAANAHYDPASESYTLYVANQNPHVERLLMCAFVLGIPEHKMRVVAPDVGGGFGSKIFLYGEETALVAASRKLGRPIKWTAERSESFLSDAHGRDHLTTVELACDKSGKFLALKVDTTANLGAYLSTFATAVPTILYATLLAGQYTTPKIHAQVKAVFTNTPPIDAYRGAGRPEATYVVERIVETAAKDLGIDPAEIRRRNFIHEFPYASPVGLTYDTGDYEATLARAIELADVQGFAARRQASEAKGFKRGLGYSCYIEACGIAPSSVAGALGARAGLFEAGEVRVHPTGKVTVFTGSHSHGQGHQERLAKLAGGVAVVKVGAATETEMKEKKHRVEDALQATRAALEEGIVPGGGVALLNAQDAIDTSDLTDGDESTGAEIVRRALEEPLRQIAENSGFEGSVIVNKVRGMKPGEGLNADSGEFGDLVSNGVIDPTMVTRSALQNSASIAKNILTTEAIVAEPPEKDGAPAGAGMPDMGGMM